MLRDLINNLHVPGAEVATVSDTTAVVSPIVDVKGYNGLAFFIGAGTLADVDATFTVLVEEGDAANLSDAAAVADADLNGTEALAGFTFAEDQKGRKVGYRGSKRYVRCTVTPVANTGSAPIAIVPVLGHPAQSPTANPPA
jgi:hypothetical protein